MNMKKKKRKIHLKDKYLITVMTIVCQPDSSDGRGKSAVYTHTEFGRCIYRSLSEGDQQRR